MSSRLIKLTRRVVRFSVHRWLSLVNSYAVARNGLLFRMACRTLMSEDIHIGDCRCCVPVRVIGGNGKVFVGDGVTLGWNFGPVFGDGAIKLQARGREAQIMIGDGTIVGANSTMIAVRSIEIGERCLIGDRVTIFDSDFHDIDPRKRRLGDGLSSPVSLGANVWIGSHCIVLKGVSIGENSVIGAGSVVSRSVPANSIACGNPARVIRRLDSQ